MKKEIEKINKKEKLLSQNWTIFTALILLIYFIFPKKININFNISKGIIGLLGVLLGFGLWAIYDYYKEKKIRKKLFLTLKNELLINLLIIKDGIMSFNANYDKIRELRNVNFEELARTGSFVGLPGDLQKDIFSTYIEINTLKKNAFSNTPMISNDRLATLRKIEKLIKRLDQYKEKL